MQIRPYLGRVPLGHRCLFWPAAPSALHDRLPCLDRWKFEVNRRYYRSVKSAYYPKNPRGSNQRANVFPPSRGQWKWVTKQAGKPPFAFNGLELLSFCQGWTVSVLIPCPRQANPSLIRIALIFLVQRASRYHTYKAPSIVILGIALVYSTQEKVAKAAPLLKPKVGLSCDPLNLSYISKLTRALPEPPTYLHIQPPNRSSSELLHDT